MAVDKHKAKPTARKRFATTELMVSIIPPKVRPKGVEFDRPACDDATSWCFGTSDCAGGTNQCMAHTACIGGSDNPYAECKSGGSTWCEGDSSGCSGGTNCAGTSTTDGGGTGECKSGGSTWCEGDSSGCSGGTHCVTGTNEPDLQGHLALVYDPDELKALRAQLGLMLQLRNPQAFRQFAAAFENPNATLNIRISGAKR